MGTKPILKTTLYAGEVEVASSTDSQIWLDTMAAITGDLVPTRGEAGHKDSEGTSSSKRPEGGGQGPVAKFAAELGVDEAELVGAASPSAEAPYIHLDHKYWEALKQNTPPRGVGSVPGVVLAATLLLLWNRHSNIGKVSGSSCDEVLRTIGHEERNRARSLRGCEWIQVRDDGLRLNPASVPSAIKLAKGYITRMAPQ